MAHVYLFPRKVKKSFPAEELGQWLVVIEHQIHQLELKLARLPKSKLDLELLMNNILAKKNIIANNWWTHQIYLDSRNRVDELKKIQSRLESQFRDRAYELILSLQLNDDQKDTRMEHFIAQMRKEQDWNPAKPVNKKVAFAWQLKAELAEQIYLKLVHREGWGSYQQLLADVTFAIHTIKEALSLLEIKIEDFEDLLEPDLNTLFILNRDMSQLLDALYMVDGKLRIQAHRVTEFCRYADEFQQIDARGNKRENYQLSGHGAVKHRHNTKLKPVED